MLKTTTLINLHDAVHAATMLNLHLVFLNTDVVVAVVHVNTSVLGSQPHCGLIHVFLYISIVDARYCVAT